MKTTYPISEKLIRIPPLGILVIAALLSAIYVHLNFSDEKYAYLAISITFWVAAWSTLSDKYQRLHWGSDRGSLILGSSLLAALLWVSSIQPGEKIVGFFPLFSCLSLGLLASGWRGLQQYRQELIIFLFLGIPRLALALIPNLLAPVTAVASTYLLWYSGWPVTLQGNTHIQLPRGSVEVVPSCSGLNLMLYMLGISVLFLVLFPTTRLQKLVLPITAMALGFVINAVRVALLAILSAPANVHTFEYWHSQSGALIFVCIAVLLFGGLCLMLLKRGPQT